MKKRKNKKKIEKTEFEIEEELFDDLLSGAHAKIVTDREDYPEDVEELFENESEADSYLKWKNEP